MNLTLLCLQAEAKWNALCHPAYPSEVPGFRGEPTFSPMEAGFWFQPAVWRGVLAAAAATVLLWTFHGVVRASMEDGDARRASAVQLDLAVWHCGRLGGRDARDECLTLLRPAAKGSVSAPLHAPVTLVLEAQSRYPEFR